MKDAEPEPYTDLEPSAAISFNAYPPLHAEQLMRPSVSQNVEAVKLVKVGVPFGHVQLLAAKRFEKKK